MAARVGIPVWRAEADERGHQIHAAGIADAGRERLLAGVADQLQAITQPLHGGAGDEDAALERVGGLPARR